MSLSWHGVFNVGVKNSQGLKPHRGRLSIIPRNSYWTWGKTIWLKKIHSMTPVKMLVWTDSWPLPAPNQWRVVLIARWDNWTTWKKHSPIFGGIPWSVLRDLSFCKIKKQWLKFQLKTPKLIPAAQTQCHNALRSSKNRDAKKRRIVNTYKYIIIPTTQWKFSWQVPDTGGHQQTLHHQCQRE